MKKKIKFLIKYIITFLILLAICHIVSFISYLLGEYLPIVSFILSFAFIGFFAYKFTQ